MDLKLFAAVLRRRKRLTVGGAVIAVVLAVLAYGHPAFKNGKPTIVPRGAAVWQSQSQLLITQQNDPYGDAAQQLTLNNGKATSSSPPLQLGGVSYMASLSPIYAAIANGDAIQTEILKRAPGDTVVATSIADPTSGAALPLVQLTATAPSKAAARKLAAVAANTLRNYVANQQAEAGVPTDRRVQLPIVENGALTKMIAGPKPTVPALVFVAILAATVTLAFVLENVRGSAAGDSDGSSGASKFGGETPSAPARRAPVVVTLSRQSTSPPSPDPSQPSLNLKRQTEPGGQFGAAPGTAE